MHPYFDLNIRRILEERTVGFVKPSLNIRPLLVLLGMTGIGLSILTGYVYLSTFQVILHGDGVITVPRPMTVNYFVKFHSFTQNHILYARSISKKQLAGKRWTDLEMCRPVVESGGEVVYPCGLISSTLPFDTVVLVKDGRQIKPSTDGIANGLYRRRIRPLADSTGTSRPPGWPNRTGTVDGAESADGTIDLGQNERYVNWIQVAAFSHFKKLFGRFHNLDAGDYSVVIEQKGNLGRRSVVLREKRWMDIDTPWLPVFQLLGGIFILIPVFV